MSQPDTRQPIEELAAALQKCFYAATNQAANEAADRVKAELEPRLDKQDATLRMIWTQCGGKAGERLPIDS